MRFISMLCVALAVGLVGNANAHIGEQVYLIFEISDADLQDINLFDADYFGTQIPKHRCTIGPRYVATKIKHSNSC